MIPIVNATDTPTAPPPVDLIDGPAGLVYLLPRAPLTREHCAALAQLLTARATRLDPAESPAT